MADLGRRIYRTVTDIDMSHIFYFDDVICFFNESDVDIDRIFFCRPALCDENEQLLKIC